MIYHNLTAKHWLVLALLFLEIIIASIHPLEMASYLLHQLGTVIMLSFLFFIQKKYGLRFVTFSLYIAFLMVHVVAAHYLYSYVPYNDWIKNIFHFDLNQSMGWTRNMFDRLVHICYGLFLVPFFLRLFQICLPNVKLGILLILVVQFVMATSLFYEWIEWWIAIGLSPDEAEKYNGQQGDIWDAHKDMFVATIGAIISAFMIKYHQKTV